MGLLELPDVRHTLVDIGTTLLCISGYNGLPGRTLPINLIHETVRRSERVDSAALSSAVSYEIPGQMMERALFCPFSFSVPKVAVVERFNCNYTGQMTKRSGFKVRGSKKRWDKKINTQ